MNEPILEVKDLTIQYQTPEGSLTAVSNASFTVKTGESFGLIGESGCGKSTIAKSLIGMLDSNGKIASGKIKYKGEEIQGLSEQGLNQKIRWKEISWIPQSSMNSLDPLQRVSEQAIEIGKTHTNLSEDELLEKFARMFDVVGLQESRMNDYPHQFSGGMQQRAIIALSLFLEPSLLIADEPTTALDVIMQDQILKYLDKIKDETQTSMVLITHDISVVLETCDRFATMHSGQVAEMGSTVDLFDTPHHPYLILLQEAFPDHRNPERELEIIEGHPPQTFGDVNQCTFVDRCPWAEEQCTQQEPPLEPVDRSNDRDDHLVSCFRKDDVKEAYRSGKKETITEVQEMNNNE